MKTMVFLFCCLILGVNTYAAEPGYHVIKKPHLGGKGGWDSVTVGNVARRLYISRSSHVMVSDIDTASAVTPFF